MKKTQEHKLGLTLGLFLATIHAVWSFAVALAPNGAKNFIDWVLGLHHLNLVYALAPFSLLNSLLLVAFTFAVGYAFGRLLGALYKKIQ